MTELIYWHWFALALLFMIAETLGAAGLLVALGMAAALTGLFTFLLGLTWQWQLVIYSLFSVALACIWWVFWRKKMLTKIPNLINQPLHSMIGRTTFLTQAIENGRGKIRMNDAYWDVTGPELPQGTTVKIMDVHDDVLLVEPLE